MASNNYNFDESQMRSLCVIDPEGNEHFYGDRESVYELASVTKLVNAITICDLVAGGFVDLTDKIRGYNLDYDEVYLYDLLTHTSGLSFEGNDKQIVPRSKRVYSNYAVEMSADFVSKKLRDEFGAITIQSLFNDGFGQILNEGSDSVFDFYGSPAYGSRSNLNAMFALATQMRNPTFIDEQMHSQMSSIFVHDLKGIVPGWGSFKDCAWGIGYEIKSVKSPHWMGTVSSPQSYGHFGRCGVFIMHDPELNISIVAMGNRQFDEYLKKIWPGYVDNILRSFA